MLGEDNEVMLGFEMKKGLKTSKDGSNVGSSVGSDDIIAEVVG